MNEQKWQDLVRYFTTYGRKHPDGLLTIDGKHTFLQHTKQGIVYGNMAARILVQHFPETEWTEYVFGTQEQFEADVQPKIG
jgi:hypothetical protein